MSDLVLYKKEGRVARVTLNSPSNLNAFTFPKHPGGMTEALVAKMQLAADDDDVTAVIIDGAGRAFSSGADVKHIGFVYGIGTGKSDRRASQRIRLQRDGELMDFYRWVMLFPKITIAQVHGACVGLGFLLVSCCDLCVASEDARLMRTDQRMGLSANALDFNHIVHNIGLKRTMHLLLTGGTLSGAEAAKLGLINEAVPEAELHDRTLELATQVAAAPRDGVAMGKALRVLNYDSLGLLAGIDIHRIGHTLFTNIRWEDDEFNYFKERRNKGAKEAFKARDESYEHKRRTAARG